MTMIIRPARQEDQETIFSFIRQAKLNPRHLRWQNFLVAELDNHIVGIRQVKIHKQGTREVASGFVLPDYRRQAISARLMNELLARERGPLYTMVNEKRAPYYAAFGFRQEAVHRLPRDFMLEYLLGRIVTTLMALLARERVRIIPMKKKIE